MEAEKLDFLRRITTILSERGAVMLELLTALVGRLVSTARFIVTAERVEQIQLKLAAEE